MVEINDLFYKQKFKELKNVSVFANLPPLTTPYSFHTHRHVSRFLHINCFRATNCTLRFILKLIISDINSNFHPKTHNLEILFPNVFIFTFIPRSLKFQTKKYILINTLWHYISRSLLKLVRAFVPESPRHLHIYKSTYNRMMVNNTSVIYAKLLWADTNIFCSDGIKKKFKWKMLRKAKSRENWSKIRKTIFPIFFTKICKPNPWAVSPRL